MKTIQTILMLLLSIHVMACKNETKEPLAKLHMAENAPTVSTRSIRVALLLDTSNSMDGLIDQAKAQLWEIVNELSYAKCKHEQPVLEIALYEYGNDGLNSRTGYLRKVLPFTHDLDEISKELFSLTTDGGSEYCGTVIKASLDELDWGNNRDDLKMIFIAGNEPFTQGSIDYRDAVNQAKEKDIVVNTIFCGDHQHGIDTYWENGAKLAYGDYMSIDHNQKTVHIASPYDDAILKLNVQLNATYLPYGSQGARRYEMQQEQDVNAASYGKANQVSRTVSKSSHVYKNTNWDLVDALEEEVIEIDDLDSKQLPEVLQGKSETEIKEYIAKLQAERERIQMEIAALNKKRTEFIASEKAKSTNGLEKAMIQAIRKQGEKKNYEWN